MHHCGFVIVYGDFVVSHSCLEFVEEELEMAVVWVDIVDGEIQSSVVHTLHNERWYLSWHR